MTSDKVTLFVKYWLWFSRANIGTTIVVQILSVGETLVSLKTTIISFLALVRASVSLLAFLIL